MEKSEVERYLDDRRDVIERALDATVAPDGSRLVESMRYSLLDGGKRVRPILVLAAGEAVGAEVEPLLPFACGVEMIHTYSLIHDDLPAMDDDELRRGRPTNHVRYGEAVAILSGDALLTDAFFRMSGGVGSSLRPEAVLGAIREIAEAAGARGMVAGQADDIAAEGSDAGLAVIEHIHRRKTGALLQASVRAGAILAGASDDALRAVTTYGERLGLAFQVVDDVMDATAPSEVTGKARGRDRERGKRTYVDVMGIDGARARASELRDEAVAALNDFGTAADPLRGIVDYVVERAADG